MQKGRERVRKSQSLYEILFPQGERYEPNNLSRDTKQAGLPSRRQKTVCFAEHSE